MSDYERIAQVIDYLDTQHTDQPDLATLAAHVGLSPSHFHRLFSRWAGITPKDFLQCLTLTHAKEMLRRGESVLDASLDAGLSGPGRLHDLCVTLEAASPGELKAGGAGWTIRAGFVETPLGTCLVGESPRGICHLAFVESTDRADGEAAIATDWPAARIVWDDTAMAALVEPLFALPTQGTRLGQPPLRAFVRGSQFQVRVWRALLRIPRGTLVSYGQLASVIGKPTAARAVGSAVGQNSLAYLIPCHRVIRGTGVVSDYRWGQPRKRALVAWESALGAG